MIQLKQEKQQEQLFAELVQLQRTMEKKLAVKEQFIKRFQALALTEERSLSLLNIFLSHSYFQNRRPLTQYKSSAAKMASQSRSTTR